VAYGDEMAGVKITGEKLLLQGIIAVKADTGNTSGTTKPGTEKSQRK